MEAGLRIRARGLVVGRERTIQANWQDRHAAIVFRMPIFRYMDNYNNAAVQKRIKNLCDYLNSLQEK